MTLEHGMRLQHGQNTLEIPACVVQSVSVSVREREKRVISAEGPPASAAPPPLGADSLKPRSLSLSLSAWESVSA